MKKLQKWLLIIISKRLGSKTERKIKNVHKSVKKFCGFVILSISMDLADFISQKVQKIKELNMVAGLICQPGKEDLMVND